MTDCQLYANHLQVTNWRGQEITDTTQVFNPGVDENDNYFVNYPVDGLSGVEVPVGDANENPCAEYSTDKIPGVNIESGNAKLPGVDTDFDAEPTGVKMDMGEYSKAYDIVPQVKVTR